MVLRKAFPGSQQVSLPQPWCLSLTLQGLVLSGPMAYGMG